MFTNSILLYIIIYNSVFLVPVVLFSMVPGVVSSRLVLVSFLVVVNVFRLVVSMPPAYCSHQLCGDASREYSAAGSLASELKVSGLFSKCDFSKYQLFGCPF